MEKDATVTKLETQNLFKGCEKDGSLPDFVWELLIDGDGDLTEKLVNPTRALVLKLVNEGHLSFLERLKPLSEETQIALVEQDNGIDAFEYIENPSADVQRAYLIAAELHGGELYAATLIETVKNPIVELQIAAVTESPSSIFEISVPCEAVQLIAIKGDPDLIPNIDNPTEAVCLIAATNSDLDDILKFIDNQTEEIVIAALKRGNQNWDYVRIPKSEAINIAHLERFGIGINFMENPTANEILTAIQDSGYAVFLAKYPNREFPSQELIDIGLKQRATELASSKMRPYPENQGGEPLEEMQLAAIEVDGVAIRAIREPSKTVQRKAFDYWGAKAVIKNIDHFRHIKNPIDEVKEILKEG